MTQRKRLEDQSSDELIAMLIDRYPAQDGDNVGAMDFYAMVLEDVPQTQLAYVVVQFFKGKIPELNSRFRPTPTEILVQINKFKDHYERVRVEKTFYDNQAFIVVDSDEYRRICKSRGRSSLPSFEKQIDGVFVSGWFVDKSEIAATQNIALPPLGNMIKIDKIQTKQKDENLSITEG